MRKKSAMLSHTKECKARTIQMNHYNDSRQKYCRADVGVITLKLPPIKGDDSGAQPRTKIIPLRGLD